MAIPPPLVLTPVVPSPSCDDGDVITSTKLDMEATLGLAFLGRLPALPPNPPPAAAGGRKEEGWPSTPACIAGEPAEDKGLSVNTIIHLFTSRPSAKAMEDVLLTLQR